jgi:hypothetical protein
VACAASLQADPITVNKADGVNFSYTASDNNGTLTVTFSNPLSFITQINNNLISPPVTASFAPLTLGPTKLTDDIPGLSGHFAPNANSTQYGITSLTPPTAPNVVFNYSISLGQVAANGMTLTGSIALAPSSATTFTQGGTTYDFSSFQNPALFTLSLGTQDATGILIYNVLKTGNGTFSGTSQFDLAVPASAVPDTGTTASLFGFSLLGLGLLRWRP